MRPRALSILLLCSLCLVWTVVPATARAADGGAPPSDGGIAGWYFPPAGREVRNQDRRSPEQVGLDLSVVDRLNEFLAAHPYRGAKSPMRWALWRHGRLVHVEGDFQLTTDVASLRKTWHAMIVGAALQQGRIPSLDQKLSQWLPELTGLHAEAT